MISDDVEKDKRLRHLLHAVVWLGVLLAGAGSAEANLCKAGSMKAAVLPEPVCDETIKSRPARRSWP